MHSNDGPETFRMIARIYMGFASAGVVLPTITAPWLLKLLTSAEFHDAWPIVGILSWQSVLYGFFMIVSAGIWKSENLLEHVFNGWRILCRSFTKLVLCSKLRSNGGSGCNSHCPFILDNNNNDCK